MELPEDGCLLRVHIGEDDRWGGVPLYEAIVQKAREFGMAGATVMRGSMGFGKSSRIHTAKVLRLSADLPVVVEIVDRPQEVEAFVEQIEGMLEGGLVTMERVKVLRYQSKTAR